ncbi:MAG: hypothetical protein ACT4PQ_02580 [Betaproteobacteria bacterium]
MRVVNTVVVCCLFVAAQTQAAAADPTEPGGPLDTCIAAVLGEHPGIVSGWRQAGGGPQPPFAITVLDKEGKREETTCDPAKPTNFEFRKASGLYRYDMYERATLPENKARTAAPVIFVGPVRFLGMELSVGFTGRTQYTYQMFLPSGHKATVEVDAVSGRLNKAEVN